MSNKNMNAAKTAQNDEFYTQYEDIEAELANYESHFKDKIVYCNCDDPYESNFFKYFASNFNFLGLKKLVATSYTGSPIANQFFIFVEDEGSHPKSAYAIEINEVKDLNRDGAVDLADVELLLKNDANASHKLQGNGSFDSPECLEFLKEADIIVSNPPFSIWRRYFEMIMKHKKEFLIIGNFLSVSVNGIRPYFINNKVWLGHSKRGMKFIIPDEEEMASVNACWYTNLPHDRRYYELSLASEFSSDAYPKYDNYDAIEVSKVKLIPKDHQGEMGVPITFMEKWNPDQFELVGFSADFQKTTGKVTNDRFYLNGKRMPDRVVIKNRNPEI